MRRRKTNKVSEDLGSRGQKDSCDHDTYLSLISNSYSPSDMQKVPDHTFPAPTTAKSLLLSTTTPLLLSLTSNDVSEGYRSVVTSTLSSLLHENAVGLAVTGTVGLAVTGTGASVVGLLVGCYE